MPLAFTKTDLAASDPANAEKALQQAIRLDELQAFDLQQQSPVRFTVYTMAPDDHRLLITLHHIAGDGWSMSLLAQEIAVLYTARIQGTDNPLPELNTQYIDYASILHEPFYEKIAEDDLSYWVDQLTDAPLLDLPTDVHAVSGQAATSGRVGAQLSAHHTGLLKELAARSSSTEFDITMTALVLLLARITDQQDISVGFPVANRQGVELEQMVGLFLNTLVLRAQYSADLSFDALLDEVRASIHDAYAHQSASFELLVERLNPVRRLDRTPLLDVMLNYLGGLREEANIDGLSIEFNTDLFEPDAKLPLSFYVSKNLHGDSEELHVDLVYRNDLFSAEYGQILLHQFLGLLAQIVEAPQRRLAEFSLIVPEAKAANHDLSSPISEPQHAMVFDMIAEQAQRSPSHSALVLHDQSISYLDLVGRAEAIAHSLVARGCAEGTIVAVTGPRSVGFYAAMLGVLRSGAVFFPLDPELPPARREQLLASGKPALCLRVGELTLGIPGTPTLDVDAGTGLTAEQPVLGKIPAVRPEAPAYLFFTSGTTGTPRGVLGMHKSLSHFLDWQRDTFRVSSVDRVAQLTTVSFDVMLRDTLLALVSGGTTVVPRTEDMLGGKSVLNWLVQQQITILHSVPTILRSWLLDATATTLLPSLRLTFLAGEPLLGELVDKYRTVLTNDAEIVNLYGPTETTMAKLFYRLPRGEQPQALLPVGTPLPQCEAIVMRGAVVCGIGEAGEIVLRTPFRTLGYLNDAKGNAAAFFSNPERQDESDLLYRTGDIGRLRADGLLEIYGRNDFQIKINGTRIHPVEIEQALNAHPGLASSLVVAYPAAAQEYHLVAYVVLLDGHSAQGIAAELRQYLSTRLPSAMIPATFMPIEKIPTNANGKPDRAALPEPQMSIDPTAEIRTPSNEAEKELLAIWESVLDHPVVGIDQDFFELGGSSLKILRLYSLLEEQYPGKLRVAQLFTHSTVARQTQLVTASPATPSRQETNEVTEYDF